MEREQILRTVQDILERAPADLAAAWVYGSVARGEHRLGSDVDVALLYRVPPPRVLDSPVARLAAELEGALGMEVECVVANQAPPDLLHRVLRDGVRVLDRDRSLRIAFQVRTRNEYFDLVPYLDRYRKKRRSG